VALCVFVRRRGKEEKNEIRGASSEKGKREERKSASQWEEKKSSMLAFFLFDNRRRVERIYNCLPKKKGGKGCLPSPIIPTRNKASVLKAVLPSPPSCEKGEGKEEREGEGRLSHFPCNEGGKKEAMLMWASPGGQESP